MTTGLILAALLVLTTFSTAENIDPDNDGSQYSWGENVGWLNWEPNTGHGVHIDDYECTGFIWAENIGWINFRYKIGASGPDTGVVNDGKGNLSGFAWSENVGWINLSPTYGGVTIDRTGQLKGWAWGENIGWIHVSASVDLSLENVSDTQVTLTWTSVFGGLYDIFSGTNPDTLTVVQTDVVGDTGTTSWIDFWASAKMKFYKIGWKDQPSYGVKTSW